MTTVFDVAEYILEQLGFVSTMKLQKLTFYSQVYALVRYGRPLFEEDFEAWKNGPVCRDLFNAHRGRFVIGPHELNDFAPSRKGALGEADKCAVSHVLRVLGSYSGRELSDLTHSELPWINARGNLRDGDYGNEIITKESMVYFYGSPCCANPVFA